MKRAALSLVVLIAAVVATAQTFPAKPVGTYVADSANLISASDRAQIGHESRDMLHKTGAPIVVATVDSLASVGAQRIGIEKYSRQMFDTWRIGSQSANHGILVVVSKADHKARIQFGGDWATRHDASAHQIMQSAMIPKFKAGDYSGGIRDGVHRLVALTEGIAASSAPSDNYPGAGPLAGTGEESSSYPGPWGPNLGPSPWIVFAPFACIIIPIFVIVIIRAATMGSLGGHQNRRNGWNDPANPNNYTSNPFSNDSTPYVPPVDYTSSFGSSDSSSSSSSSDSGGFDSGSSSGGGDTGSW